MSNSFFQHMLSNQFPGLVIPKGSLFYPCCGDDLWEPIRLFADVIDEFHFVDIGGIPPLSRIVRFECLDESEVPKNPRDKSLFVLKNTISHVSEPETKPYLINASTEATEKRLKIYRDYS